jgi:hypothetical protein
VLDARPCRGQNQVANSDVANDHCCKKHKKLASASLHADIHWTQPFWALASADEFSYFVTIRRVGATVLVGAMGEIENVNHVFHPAGRLAASNSLYPYAETAVPSFPFLLLLQSHSQVAVMQ